MNLQSLKSLGDLLVDIHGQHFHQSLCKKNVQRDLLDHFGGLSVTKNKIKRIFNEWKELSDQLSKMIESNDNKEDRVDLLNFQLKELNQLALTSGEYNSLNSEFKKISNIELPEGTIPIIKRDFIIATIAAPTVAQEEEETDTDSEAETAEEDGEKTI